METTTASDWTMYPFSTQNSKDFQNLLSVYLDSAFFPQLKELDFRQEGWRLEHEDATDPSSPIIFKGVVFNEMKGHFVSFCTGICFASRVCALRIRTCQAVEYSTFLDPCGKKKKESGGY